MSLSWRIVARLNEDFKEADLPLDPLEAEFVGEAHEAPAALWRAAVIAAWASGRAWGVNDLSKGGHIEH